MLSREAILAKRPRRAIVRVDDWEDDVILQAFTVRRRVELLDVIFGNRRDVALYEEDQERDEGEREGIAKVDLLDEALVTIIFSVVNEDGLLMFTMKDYDIFVDLSYTATAAMWAKAISLNEAKPVEEAHEALKKTSD